MKLEFSKLRAIGIERLRDLPLERGRDDHRNPAETASKVEGLKARIVQEFTQDIASKLEEALIVAKWHSLAFGPRKSTLRNLISGIVTPASGAVSIDGRRIDTPNLQCGIVFQQRSLFPWMSGLETSPSGPEC